MSTTKTPEELVEELVEELRLKKISEQKAAEAKAETELKEKGEAASKAYLENEAEREEYSAERDARVQKANAEARKNEVPE